MLYIFYDVYCNYYNIFFACGTWPLGFLWSQAGVLPGNIRLGCRVLEFWWKDLFHALLVPVGLGHGRAEVLTVATEVMVKGHGCLRLGRSRDKDRQCPWPSLWPQVRDVHAVCPWAKTGSQPRPGRQGCHYRDQGTSQRAYWQWQEPRPRRHGCAIAA